ncbi:pectin lyase [Phlyctema vagabunda]|uniref:pectin lyase n=1 Tax=Phlyctema vagabunda TaxID=108571 RepID=A0ABR4P4F4_9HELO
MVSTTYLALGLLSLIARCAADGVVGTPVGFASGTTGGGKATPVYPSSLAQLKSYLADDVARVIVLNKEFNFINSEGKTTETGCRPASNTCGSKGQDAINKASWCTNGNAGAGVKSISVTYDTAAQTPLEVKSNKSIVGVGSKGVLRGKGLRIANGAKNVIIQNIHITELNPQYIWGGDAITIAGSDLVWIDHVKISLIGRQMIVLGTNASNRVSITNNELDGNTSWSATCNNHHYWTLYLTGSSDLVTLKGNYIHHTSGRGPKVGGNTLLHAVNNYWYDTAGHAFDIAAGSNAVIEGNIFQNVVTPLNTGSAGGVFAAPSTTANAQCSSYLGHTCQLNAFGSSGTLTGSTVSFFKNFQGKSVATASAPNAASIVAGAGIGKI